MKKQCKECLIEFEPITKKGSEQLYCSQICRSRAASERFKQRLINSNTNNYDNTTNSNRIEQIEVRNSINESTNRIPDIIGSNQTMFARDNRAEFSGYNGRIASEYNNSNFQEYIALIRENANLRAEVKLLTEKVTNLESELMDYELEDEMEEEQQPGFLGNIMNAYKKDPTTTVLFAKDMIFEFLKPKNNEQNKKPNA
jgi:hypothetical protein